MSKRPITWERLCEIATMSLRRLEEIDKDSAWKFYMSEIGMDIKELGLFELHRERKAVNIMWYNPRGKEVPDEINIPDDVDADDITYFIEEQYKGAYIVDYELEEEGE